MDPVADKVFIGSIATGLCYKGLIPSELLAIILGRDGLLIIGGLSIRAIEKEKNSDFFDTTSRSATFEIIPTNLSKVFYFIILQYAIALSPLNILKQI